ncbi:MAG TPA: hypothetical protein VJ962_01515 [Clostridia bacterium]|nr:hypothetical protein [Clostridia bacterium]
MLLIIGYYLISGAVFYFAFRYIFRQTDKVNPKKIPLVFGYINVILGIIFLVMYFMNPSAFSPDITINNQVLYILMAIFSTYFYSLAPGISTGNLMIIYKQKKQALIKNNHFYLALISNLTAVFCFGLLTYQLFG